VIVRRGGEGKDEDVRIEVVRVGRDAHTHELTPMPTPIAFPILPRGKGEQKPLGTREFDGIKADGTMTSYTIPAGQIGNEKPIVVTSERWFSPELHVVVYAKNSDPRTGDTIYRLANVKRGEPPAELFKVPGGLQGPRAVIAEDLEPHRPRVLRALRGEARVERGHPRDVGVGRRRSSRSTRRRRSRGARSRRTRGRSAPAPRARDARSRCASAAPPRAVPSGAIARWKTSCASSAACICATKPVRSRRLTGMPPQRRKQRPQGRREHRVLADPAKSMPRTHFASRPTGKSQFDVCG
jgi:hypothetical protein